MFHIDIYRKPRNIFVPLLNYADLVKILLSIVLLISPPNIIKKLALFIIYSSIFFSFWY